MQLSLAYNYVIRNADRQAIEGVITLVDNSDQEFTVPAQGVRSVSVDACPSSIKVSRNGIEVTDYKFQGECGDLTLSFSQGRLQPK